MQSEVLSFDDGSAVDLTEFLTEFAHLLLGAGISHDQFSRLSELAFLRAAVLGARFQNSRINQSAVAAMTGLNRTKVRSLLRSESRGRKPIENKIDRVIAVWVSEAELLTSTGQPRKLKLTGERASFSWLAKRYGGDLPPKSLLRELSRRRLVRVSKGSVALSASARRTRETKRLAQISHALATVLKRPSIDAESRSVRVSTFEVAHQATTAVGRVLLQKRISKILRAFMSEVEAASAAIALEAPAPAEKEQRLAKTGVFLISQD
jgi:hypothetical protein